ncbi:MAG: phosphoribosylaminoimidazolesuccinocarboxamide synthase [Gammaproteobacteria bacterium]|nr:phosphoribosylaminoimidazolesuccinocarboxamide synthase [Gammaproteobacteria bacterium]
MLYPELSELKHLHQGKVRDIYEIDDKHIAMVASDRLSAFDVILPDAISGKGATLTRMAHFWFDKFQDVVPNHLVGKDLKQMLGREISDDLNDRTTVAMKLKPLPIEAVVRGYIVGSGWKDYQQSGAICGIALPEGLSLADQLPEPIFTPAYKADVGDHDENISFEKCIELVGDDLAEQVKAVSLDIYHRARAYAAERGVIIADTKFEFGLDSEGKLRLMDEVLTPDSSRFWPAEQWFPGQNPPSYDKQFVRDYLETLDWDKTPPGPKLPAEIIEGTQAKYQEAWLKLSQ